eukprot:44069_1
MIRGLYKITEWRSRHIKYVMTHDFDRCIIGIIERIISENSKQIHVALANTRGMDKERVLEQLWITQLYWKYVHVFYYGAVWFSRCMYFASQHGTLMTKTLYE